MSDLTETITLENAVGSAGIDQELNLESLAKDLEDSEFDPDRFPGLIHRSVDPKATVLVFRTGRIVITGANQIEDLQTTLERFLTALDDLGIDVPDDPTVTVQNLVCGADLGKPLNLNAIAIGLGLERVEYEPEQFPGLVYRRDDPPVVVLLFGSGKLVITGATKMADVETAVINVSETLNELGMLG